MKRKALVTLVTTMMMAGLPAVIPAAHGASHFNYTFGEHSVLANGRWVKVEVSQSGIYEISYDELRAMGFDNPSNVSVYGSGGRARSTQLYLQHSRTQSDDPVQKPVLHKNNKIYFYGEGTGEIAMGPTQFERRSKNIYTAAGHYYLTDSGKTLTLSTPSVSAADGSVSRDKGLGYFYHEEDRIHGLDNDGYGINFWEYQMMNAAALRYDVPTPLAADGATGTLTVGMAPNIVDDTDPATLTLTAFNKNYTATLPSLHQFSSWTGTFSDVTIVPEASKASMLLSLSGSNEWQMPHAYMDYLVFNYAKDISKAGNSLVCEELGLPFDATITGTGKVTAPGSAIVWDITDAACPVNIAVKDGEAIFNNAGDARRLIFFNPSKEQLKVANPQPIANQDLHGLQSEPYAMIIVTVPEFRKYADEIAALHEKHDGTKVLVVTPEECYNEFTDGNPDPMAIRMLAKMIYQKNGAVLRNMLLLGPIRIDARNVANHPQPDHFIIGVHEGGYISGRKAGLVLDFYGMLSDNVNLSSSLFNQDMHIGVGTLHISSDEEARKCVTKIRNYLELLDKGEMAWVVDETMSMGCDGDENLHNNAAIEIEDAAKRNASTIGCNLMHHTIMPNFYSDNQAADISRAKFKSGKLMNIYIGHAGATGLSNGLRTEHLINTDTRYPGFIMFAGCDITIPDFGGSGIGSEIVLNTTKGFMGSISSTRTAWSSNNLALSTELMNGLFHKSANTSLTSPTTIGEAYAYAKSAVTGNFNELTYIYVGDPGLTVPVPLRKVTVSTPDDRAYYTPGELVTISGEVLGTDGKRDASFNGKAVLKLHSGSEYRYALDNPDVGHRFIGDRLAAVETDVTEGRFTVSVTIPAEAARYTRSDNGRSNIMFYVSAYNPSIRLAASGSASAVIVNPEKEGAESSAQHDTTAPRLNVTYDAGSMRLLINASDETALLPGIGNGGAITLRIDGEPVTLATGEGMEGCGRRTYDASLGMAGFSKGTHSVRATATDMAGNNSSPVNLNVNVTEPEGMLLTAEKIYGTERVKFNIGGAIRDGLAIYIYDNEGYLVHEESVTGKSYVWECADAPRGDYRAVVRYAGGSPGASKFAKVTLVD